MGWKVSFETDDGEKVVDMDDLPAAVYDAAAKADPDANHYWDVYSQPFLNITRSQIMMDAAADHISVQHIAVGELSMGDLNRKVQFDLPISDQPMVDGFPQEPGETESGSSSGAPGDSDGIESSADDSLSVTS